MKLQLANSLRTGLVLLAAGSVYAQQPLVATGNPDLEGQVAPAVDSSSPPAAEPATAAASKPEPTLPPKHKIGPLEISVNWRTRAEGWYWFEGKTGNSDYGFWDSLLRVGIGQSGEHFDWFLEGEQPSILGLPNNAVVGAPQGQLGLGGNYYAANNNHSIVANGFVKQAFVSFKKIGPAGLKLGRFEYFDGLEGRLEIRCWRR
jgi:hypothetical protein